MTGVGIHVLIGVSVLLTGLLRVSTAGVLAMEYVILHVSTVSTVC